MLSPYQNRKWTLFIFFFGVLAFGACDSSAPLTELDSGNPMVQPDVVDQDVKKEDAWSPADIQVTVDGSVDGIGEDVLLEDSAALDTNIPDAAERGEGGDAIEEPEEDVILEDVQLLEDVTGEPDVVTSLSLKVLFIGNSYTSANNLASLVTQVLEGEGVEIETQAITKGGAWLQNHLDDAATVETITNGGWTHVVLQEQSYLPLVAPETFQTAATGLATLIHDVNAIPVFFETWARKEGNALYQGDLDGFTPLMMQAALRGAYTQAADANDGVYAPVGDAWEASLDQHPEIPLHSGDGSHPGIQGSYLAAVVFYGVLVDGSPVGLSWWPESITPEHAAILHEMAASVLP